MNDDESELPRYVDVDHRPDLDRITAAPGTPEYDRQFDEQAEASMQSFLNMAGVRTFVVVFILLKVVLNLDSFVLWGDRIVSEGMMIGDWALLAGLIVSALYIIRSIHCAMFGNAVR